MQQDESPPRIHFGDRSEHVLVTGATGFIGQLLVRALLADGQHVTVLSRNTMKAATLFHSEVQCIENINELPPTHKIDVIINLAGARILGWRWTATRKSVLRQSRIGLTQSIVAWIATAQHKPRLLLSGSAIGYYGVQALGDDTALTEDSQPQPIFMSQLCQEWESAARCATIHGVHVVCMRLGFVLGHQGSLPLMMLPIKLCLGGPLGAGRQWLSWIHVHDVLRGIAHLWNAPAQRDGFEAYNFTAPEPVSQNQFSQTAAKVVHRPCFFPTPGLPMRVVLGEQADLLLKGQRVVPSRLLDSGFSFDFPDCRAALENLYQKSSS